MLDGWVPTEAGTSKLVVVALASGRKQGATHQPTYGQVICAARLMLVGRVPPVEPSTSKLVIACAYAGIEVATRQLTAIAVHCSERRSFMMRTPSRSDISALLFRVVKASDAGPMNSTHERLGGVN